MILKSLVFLSAVLSSSVSYAELNIYTDRPATQMEPLVAEFEELTGETVNSIEISANDAIDRLLAEGDMTPADIVIAKDMLYLNDMSNLGLLQPMSVSTDHIPAQMQHPEKLWAAVTMRARTVVYNKETVDPSSLTTYASLGDEQWKGKLCLRTSASSYNKALVAGFVTDLGFEGAKALMESWIANLAVAPIVDGGDRAVLEAVENGVCSIGVVNSYYLGQENDDGDYLNVGIVFLNQNSTGVHVNGTGAGIVAASQKLELANTFLEIFYSSSNQELFSGVNFDYPVSAELLPRPLVADWGSFALSQNNWSVVSDNVDEAQRVIDEVGYE